MILDLAQQGLSVTAIARRTGMDRKTIRKYLAQGLEPPAYKPRARRPTVITPYEAFLRERLRAFPDLSGRRLLREIRDLGYTGGYTVLKDFLRRIRPTSDRPFRAPVRDPTRTAGAGRLRLLQDCVH